jgi:hypothetical protein
VGQPDGDERTLIERGTPGDSIPFFQLGIVCSDIDAAMAELTRVSGLTWGRIRHREMGPWKYKLAFSHQGPPHVELVEAPPGSPWNPNEDGSMRIDHFQLWSSDIEADTAYLEEGGATIDVDGVARGHPFRYYKLAGGLRVELIQSDDASRAAYKERWLFD